MSGVATDLESICEAAVSTRLEFGDPLMFDLVMIAAGAGFFALSVGYTIACSRL